jgi:hypothetical protein
LWRDGWHFRRFPNISINRFRVDTESLKNLADAPVFPQQTDYEMTRTDPIGSLTDGDPPP